MHADIHMRLNQPDPFSLNTLLSGFAFVALSMFLGTAIATVTPSEQLRVDATQVRETLCVYFRMRNIGTDSLELPKYQLPWGDRYSIVLLGIGENDEDPIKLAKPVSVPTTGRISVPSQGEVRGRIDLRHYLVNIEAIAARATVLVFWSWHTPNHKGDAFSGRKNGFIVLPKGSAAGCES